MFLGLALGIAGLTRAYMLGVGTEVAQVVAKVQVQETYQLQTPFSLHGKCL
jgi:hypothetical protein